MNKKYYGKYLIKPDGNGGDTDRKLAVEYSDKQIAEMLANGYAIISRDEFSKLIGNADKAYLIASDGTLYPKPDPTEEELLAAAKPVKIAELKAQRDSKEVEPIEYSGNSYDYDEKARERINAAIVALDVQTQATGLEASIAWTTADNQDVKVTANDLRAVIALVANRSNALHVAYRKAKDKVESATTVAAVSAVTLDV